MKPSTSLGDSGRKLIDLYMVVGQDMVTFWLGQGWELYGSPQLDSYGWMRQPIIKRKQS